MPRRFDHIADVEVFVTVVEKGSLTAAAVALSTTPSVLSRAITRLEARLGGQLMRRSTRSHSLTEAGQVYLEQARAALALIEDADRSVQASGASVKGRVRLSVSTTYGHYRLPQRIARFRENHPEVEIEISISNRNVDLIAEGYDLAIRAGPLQDSGLIGRKLEDAPFTLAASPDYLRRAGIPERIDDLEHHCCLPFIMPSTGKPVPWLFSGQAGEMIDWVPGGPIRIVDDVLGIVSLAQAGVGICQTYDFIVRERIERGVLVELLPQASGRSRPFSLIYAPHRRLSAATRVVIDTLIDRD